MQHSIEDIEYAEYLFDRFYGIGSSDNGGVTRLGYTEVEDEMHDTLRALGDEKGYGNYEDEVGNTYLYDKDCDMDDPYYLIGSHLDSASGWAPCAVRNPATLAGAPSAAA